MWCATHEVVDSSRGFTVSELRPPSTLYSTELRPSYMSYPRFFGTVKEREMCTAVSRSALNRSLLLWLKPPVFKGNLQ